MDLIQLIVGAVQSIGFPQVISLGLLAVIWQQTGVLKGIRDCLDQMHDTLRRGACKYTKEKDDEQIHQASAPVRSAADFWAHRDRG